MPPLLPRIRRALTTLVILTLAVGGATVAMIPPAPAAAATAPDRQAQSINGFTSLNGTSRRANQPATLNATATSGLAVTYSTDTSSVCSVSNSILSFSRAGTCTVRASQAGDEDWQPAPELTQTLTVTLVPQVFTGVPVYTDARMGTEVPYPPDPAAVTTSGRDAANLGIGWALGGDCSFNDTWDAIRLDRVGTCQVVVIAYGDTYWAETTLVRSFRILPEQVTQTIAFPAPADMRVGDAAQTLTSTTSSGLAATYSSRTASVCTVAAGKVSAVSAGTCTIRATQSGGTVGNSEYTSVTEDASFTVRGAYQAQTLTISDLPRVRINDTATVTVTSNTTLPYDVASTTPAVCGVAADRTTITLLDTGTCTIGATAEAGTVGADDYLAAAAEKSFDVWPAPRTQSLAFPALVGMRPSDEPQELGATSSADLQVGYTVDTPAVCSVADGAVTALAAGTCTITATQPGNVTSNDRDVFAAAEPVERSFQVRGDFVAQTITFAAPDDMRVGDPDQSIPATASSLLPAAVTSTSPAICTVTEDDGGWAVTALAPGRCTLRASQPGGTRVVDDVEVDYAAAEPLDRDLTVRPRLLDQNISFGGPTVMRVGDAALPLTATASSGLPVELDSTTPSVCSVSDAAVIGHTVGTCTLTASQPGGVVTSDDEETVEYRPAPPETISFPVESRQIAQTIQVRDKRGVALSAKTAPVSFTSSAGLPVRAVSVTPRVCTVSSGSVRLRAAGECRLSATAAGDEDHLAAAPVTVRFPVWAAPTLPQRAKTLRVLDVLGRGEGHYRVAATPAAVCVTARKRVVLIGAGTCAVTVRHQGAAVRKARIAVAEARGAHAADALDLAGSVRFAFGSAALSPSAKKTLRGLAPKLRTARLVVVYGNTQAFGGGETPANRKLSRRRAVVVAEFLRGLRVKARSATVGMASRNPVSKDDAANRRAEVYWLR